MVDIIQFENIRRIIPYTKTELIANAIKKSMAEVQSRLFENEIIPIKYNKDKFHGKNKYTLIELREIAKSHGIDVKIEKRYKTYNMLCDELTESFSEFINVERLNTGKYTIIDLRMFSQLFEIPVKINNVYKSYDKLVEEIIHNRQNKLNGLAPYFMLLIADKSQLFGITYYRDIVRELRMVDYNIKTKKQLYGDIYEDYMKNNLENVNVTKPFNGNCINPNIMGEDWNNINSNDVIVDEYNYGFTKLELLNYRKNNINKHPWLGIPFTNVRALNSEKSIMNMVDDILVSDTYLCNKIITRTNEYKLIKNDIDIYHANKNYLITRIETRMSYSIVYLENISITITNDNYETWWNSFKCLQILNKSVQPKEVSTILSIHPKCEVELLECINQILDKTYKHLEFNLLLCLYFLFRKDKIFKVSELNNYIMYGFPDNAF